MDIKKYTQLLKKEAQEYKQNHDNLTEKYKADLKNVENTYVKNTPIYHQVKEDLKAEYDKQIQALRAEGTRTVSKATAELKEYEKSRISKVDEAKLAKLRAIKDMTLTSAELEVLAEVYHVENDYWCSRMLSEIAQANGIDGFGGVMENDYESKLSIINELSGQFGKIVSSYPSQFKDEQLKLKHVYLNDAVCERAVDKYLGRISEVNSESSAAKAWSSIVNKSTELERAGSLANVLRNAKDDKREEILFNCCIQNGLTISQNVIDMCGFGEEIEAFRAKGVENYQLAKKAVSKIVDAKDDHERKDILAQNIDNPFIAKRLERAGYQKNDNSLLDLADIAAAGYEASTAS